MYNMILAENLLKSMLERNPKERITAK